MNNKKEPLIRVAPFLFPYAITKHYILLAILIQYKWQSNTI